MILLRNISFSGKNKHSSDSAFSVGKQKLVTGGMHGCNLLKSETVPKTSIQRNFTLKVRKADDR